LPFVFAAWVARPAVDPATIVPALAAARDRGMERIDVIAEREAELLGLETELARDYLRTKLRFRLGRQELRGLALFHRHCVELALAPAPVNPLFEGIGVDDLSLVG
jgi:chorismate dehydratase